MERKLLCIFCGGDSLEWDGKGPTNDPFDENQVAHLFSCATCGAKMQETWIFDHLDESSESSGWEKKEGNMKLRVVFFPGQRVEIFTFKGIEVLEPPP